MSYLRDGDLIALSVGDQDFIATTLWQLPLFLSSCDVTDGSNGRTSIPYFFERCVFRCTSGHTFDFGNPLTFANTVQLIHETSGKVMVLKSLQESNLSSTGTKCQALVLQDPATFSEKDKQFSRFKLMPRVVIHTEGSPVVDGVQVDIVSSVQSNAFFHVAEANGATELNAAATSTAIRLSAVATARTNNSTGVQVGDVVEFSHLESLGYLSVERPVGGVGLCLRLVF
jgi:hypothetical protein